MTTFAYSRKTPLIVLVAQANLPLVQVCGGHLVTEEFFDNDQNAPFRKADSRQSALRPFYDFIDGEPYGRWI